MLTTAQLFGIALAPIYAAIADIESCDGKTSHNVYQLTRWYVADCNRITGGKYNHTTEWWDGQFFQADRYMGREKSERMMLVYWRYYGGRFKRRFGFCNKWVLIALHRFGYDAVCDMTKRGICVYDTAYCQAAEKAMRRHLKQGRFK